MDHMDRYFQRKEYREPYFRHEVAQTRAMLLDVLSGDEQFNKKPMIIAVSSQVWRIRLLRRVMRTYMTFEERRRFQLRLWYKDVLEWPRAELIVVQPGKELVFDSPRLKDLDVAA